MNKRMIEVHKFFDKLRSGPYTSVGFYPVFFIMKNGQPISYKVAKDNAKRIGKAILNNNDTQWQVDNSRWSIVRLIGRILVLCVMIVGKRLKGKCA